VQQKYIVLVIKWDFQVAGEVTPSMKGYIDDIITRYNVKKRCNTPALDNLFTIDSSSPLLSDERRELYHSCVMTLYYLAKRFRFDILTAISFCTTRVLHPTAEKYEEVFEDLGLSPLHFEPTPSVENTRQGSASCIC
jgi:hypothetical protein